MHLGEVGVTVLPARWMSAEFNSLAKFLQINVDEGAGAVETAAFNTKNDIKNCATGYGECPPIFNMAAYPHKALVGGDGNIVANFRYRSHADARGERIGVADFPLLTNAAALEEKAAQ
jgi:hypothetical protein